jgi:hypothetical protein
VASSSGSGEISRAPLSSVSWIRPWIPSDVGISAIADCRQNDAQGNPSVLRGTPPRIPHHPRPRRHATSPRGVPCRAGHNSGPDRARPPTHTWGSRSSVLCTTV